MKKFRIACLCVSCLLAFSGTSCNDNNNNISENAASVVLENTEHGTISSSITSGEVGDACIITITPDSGYEVNTFKVNGFLQTPKDNQFKFLLVAGTNTISCSFKIIGTTPDTHEEASVILGTHEHGKITANITEGYAGDKCEVTITPDSGYELDTFKINNELKTVVGNKFAFFLIAGKNQIDATFKVKGTETSSNGVITFECEGNDMTATTDLSEYTIADGVEIKSAVAENAYPEYNRIRFGSSKKIGSGTFTFKTAVSISSVKLGIESYNEDGSSVEVTFGGVTKSAVIDADEIEIQFGSTITGDSLKISTTAIKKRFYLEKISFGSGTVTPVGVSGITKTSSDPIKINKGASVNLSNYYSISPSNATNKNVSYSSSSAAIKISGNNISCDTIGSYKVTALTEDGGFTAEFDIEVVETGGIEPTTKLPKSDIRFDYLDVNHAQEGSVIPSTGSPNILVVPVQFSDLSSTWTSSRLTALDGALNGTKADGSNDYWESLASFYKKSSYGNLNLTYTVCDALTPSMTASTFKSKTDDYGTESLLLIDEIYSKMTVKGASVKNNWSSYDSDSDGYIDGVWFIYNEFNMDNVGSDSFWAYTYWYYDDSDRSTSLSDCKISCFANMAGAFNYEESAAGLDAHTLIHESGHMLGLDDYYSYDTVSHSAMGDLDMMDFNIGDHNAFSKFSLGWVEPNIAKSGGSITLKPFESSGDCLIIPSGYFNNSAFSEYLILEYYTPTGVNYLDSHTKYSTRDMLFTKSGIKALHADARLMKLDNDWTATGTYLSSTATSIPAPTSSNFYGVAASNTQSSAYNKYPLIEIIDATNKRTYNNHSSSNNSIWGEGTNINKTTASAFFSSGKFHDGTTYSWNISIDSVTTEGVTLTLSLA